MKGIVLAGGSGNMPITGILLYHVLIDMSTTATHAGKNRRFTQFIRILFGQNTLTYGERVDSP